MPIQTFSHGKVTWIDITHPTPADMREIAGRFPQIHPLNLKDCLTDLEIPKLDHLDGYIFLVVQMPVWSEKEQISRPAEVDIFIFNGILITSHRAELKQLVDLYARVQSDLTLAAEVMGAGSSPLLYHLLNDLVDACYPMVQRVSASVRQVEERIFRQEVHEALHAIASLRRDIIALRSILKAQMAVVQTLIHGNWSVIHEDLDPYWGDIGDHLSLLCSSLDQYSEVISGISDTVDTLASHRIDEVVRILTLVTVFTLPLTLLATLFGMNIRLPFSEHPWLFYTLLGLGLAFSAALIWYLRHKKWL